MPLFAGLPLPVLDAAELGDYMPWLIAVDRGLRTRHAMRLARTGVTTDEVVDAFRHHASPEAFIDGLGLSAGARGHSGMEGLASRIQPGV